jgi:hypothetical protein
MSSYGNVDTGNHGVVWGGITDVFPSLGGEDLIVQTVWLIPISVVAAVNLRLIVPGVLARLGFWKPHLD